MSSYRERLHAGYYEPGTEQTTDEPDADVEAEANHALPRTHADLDALAEERGHEWSTHELTVAEKQAELGS